MDLPIVRKKPAGGPPRMLLRGESTIASAGLAMAAIVLCAMGGAAWWSARVQQDMMTTARTDEIRSVGLLLAELAGNQLATGQVSRTRQLIAEAARRHEFSDCRIVLPSGEVIAAKQLSHITLASLPETWTDGPVTQVKVPALEGEIAQTYAINVDGRGSARIDITAVSHQPAWDLLDMQAGIGLIAAGALLALLLVYRRMRSRMRTLSYIRESLLALDAGETALAALTVKEDLGAEAIAWNELLSERETLQQVLITKRLLEFPSARQDRNQDLTNMCDAMSQGLILVDSKLFINYANGAAALYLGKTREEILGTKVDQAIDDPQIIDIVTGIADGTVRGSTSAETDRTTGDTKTVLRFAVRPVRREDESAAMIVIEDITQQRLADDSRNTFVAQVTHELRTPLTNILLYAETAMEDGATDFEMIGKAMNVINQEARRLERIVSDMLSVAELEAGTHVVHLDDLPLSTLFEDLQRDYEASAREKSIVLEFTLPPKLPVIQADRDKITTSVHNLLGNALKYTPEGGHVIVEVDCDDTSLVIKVSDNGIGMRTEDVEHVFEKFYRAKDDRVGAITGSGLGLTLSRELIRLHGGEITVDSEIDKGSTFTLVVPIMTTTAA